MNYYIQGNKEKADQINAAFKKLGYDTSGHLFNANSVLYFTLDGEIRATTCNCTPAIIKTHPDYKELELPVEFKDGDIIGFNDCTHNDGSYVDWVGIYKEKADAEKSHFFHCVITSKKEFRIGILSWRVFTAYPATKEQRDLLFAKIKEAGYEWDAEKKELRKTIKPKFKVGDSLQSGSHFTKILSINLEEGRYYCDNRIISFENQDLWHLVPKPHYDIANFHAGMPVLVRDYDGEEWNYLFFSHYRKKSSDHFFAGGNPWSQCIPFGEDTKHLLGTTDMCPEEYINW